MRERVAISWSGGKDSMLALDALLADDRYQVVGLTATLNEDRQVAMHEVPEAFLDAQAAALGLPLTKIILPRFPANAAFEAAWLGEFRRLAELGCSAIAFGDLFLADLRAWREALVARSTLSPLFPLWQQDTRALAQRFVERGFEAVVTCVDGQRLPAHCVGQKYDADFLGELPADVDPCGENGEFHTFVTAGPLLRQPIGVCVRETFTDGRFHWVRLDSAECKRAELQSSEIGAKRT